jgi:cysteine desulfurase
VKTIYLDHAAASPFQPAAIEVFTNACQNLFANASATHHLGQCADHALQNARETVAKLIGASENEIVFTANATEANNLAIKGVAQRAKREGKGNHIIISSVEHPAVENAAKALAAEFGFEVDRVGVTAEGFPQQEKLLSLLRPTTVLVSLIHGNNEVGTVSPLANFAAICRERDVLLHTDAAQSCAWQKIDVGVLSVDLLTGSGRKMGAPGGGFLFVRKGVQMSALLSGGGHEQGLRSGTPHVPEIAALAKAFELKQQALATNAEKVVHLRNYLIQEILRTVPHCVLTGSPESRLANHASFAFEGLEGNALARRLSLRGFAVSPGAACKTGNPAPSTTLKEMGFSDDLALGGLRISIGFETTTEDVESLLQALPTVVDQLRKNKG